MREIRQSGSEGGATSTIVPTPILCIRRHRVLCGTAKRGSRDPVGERRTYNRIWPLMVRTCEKRNRPIGQKVMQETNNATPGGASAGKREAD